ncbi:AMP-binding protein [Amycolatopsis sp. cg5]|uniref:AMP-binding protein n=1 Tax=Amycolatopsis sp. cg5 TaxID=3238802 RepID=UPI00352469B8
MSEDLEVSRVGPPVNYVSRWLPELVVRQAHRTPAAVAVLLGDNALTYSALVDQAYVVAARLRAAGVVSPSVVAVRGRRSLRLPVLLLGVLLSGNAYVVVDPRWPDTRIEEVLAEVSATTVIDADTSGRDSVSLPDVERSAVESLRSETELLADADRLDDPFCVYYTSGSSGHPKASISPHRAVLRSILAPGHPSLDFGVPVMLVAAPPSWDAFTMELWFPLVHGGRCVIVEHDVLDPATIRRGIRDEGVTVALVTASLFHVLVDEDLDCFDGMRELSIGGERMSPRHARRFLERFPDVRLVNAYGPVETSVHATAHTVTPADPDRPHGVPIGSPVPGTEIRLLPVHGRPADVGEIAIAGDGLATGYANSFGPGETDPFPLLSTKDGVRRFYRTGDLGSWNDDATLAFRGRLDRQIKLRGHRVDPTEVERAIEDPAADESDASRGGVAACHVEMIDHTLTAFVVPADGFPGTDALTHRLGARLPAYLLPGRIVVVDEIPLTATGKLDRAALAASVSGDAATQGDRQPADPATTGPLVALAAELITAGQVDASTDLIAAGLDSLGALRLAVRATIRLGRPLTAAMVLQHRTPAGICAALTEPSRSDSANDTGQRPATDTESQWLTGMVAEHRAAASLVSFAFRMTGPVAPAAVHDALLRVAAAQQAMRTAVAVIDGTVRARLLPVNTAVQVRVLPARPNRHDLDEMDVVAAEAMRAVRLDAGPIVAARIVPEPDGLLLVLGAHHSNLDGHSNAVLVDQLCRALRDEPLTERRPVDDSDRDGGARPPDSWSARLAAAGPISWPAPHGPTPDYATLPVRLTAADLTELTTTARAAATTPAVAALHAFARSILSTIDGSSFRIGMTDSGRNDASTVDVLGNFVRLLPVPFDRHTVDSGLAGTRDAWRHAYRQRHVTITDRLAQLAVNPRYRPPYLQVLLVWQNLETPVWQLPGVKGEDFNCGALAPMFDLTLELWPGPDGATGVLEYDPRVVADRTALAVHRSLMDQFGPTSPGPLHD